MKYIFLFFLSSCSATTIINDTLLENAECICRSSGGINGIKVRTLSYTANKMGMDMGEIKVYCNSGLESPWWSFNGPKATPPAETSCK